MTARRPTGSNSNKIIMISIQSYDSVKSLKQFGLSNYVILLADIIIHIFPFSSSHHEDGKQLFIGLT
jgi:hypothetical protein